MIAIKLSSFYFSYFALLGVMAPYLGLFLESRGFSSLEIGQLTALLMFTKVMAPYIWGSVADSRQQRLPLVRMGAMFTFFCYLGFFWVESFWGYAVVIVSFSFFWNAILPQYEVLTLHNLGEARDRYSQIRLWGSLGFILAVALLGYLFDQYGIRYFPVALVVVVVGIFITTLFRLAEPGSVPANCNSSQSLMTELMCDRTYAFFLMCFLLQASHGAYYTYFSLYMKDIGYGEDVIGLFWALGVFAEVLLFIGMHRWQAKHSLKLIMQIALCLTIIRWVLIGRFADSWTILIFAQCLHALSFGAMHATAIHFVHQKFSMSNQGRAQAMYSSLGFGAGGVAGAVLSAMTVGEANFSYAFYFSAVAAVIALIVSMFIRQHAPTSS